MSTLRILTFNHHESYIALMAKTGFQFDVVIRRGALDLSWQKDRVAVPENVRLVEWDQSIIGDLKAKRYDVIVCHTIKNLIWMLPFFGNRFVFIAHIPLYYDTFAQRLKSWSKRQILGWFRRLYSCQFVAIAKLKEASWKTSGTIIHPTVNPFPPVHPHTNYDKVVLVCNHLKQRGAEMGWPLVATVMASIPVTIVGLNPGITSSQRLGSYPEFQEYLRGFRIYLYPIEQPFGDGFNLALLEAMSMGMVPVTIFNPSSPVQHNVNGLVGRSAAELVTHIRNLMNQPEDVDRLGAAARRTVATDFSQATFCEMWRAKLLQTAQQTSRSQNKQ